MSKLLDGSVKGHLARMTLPGIGGMLAIMIFNLTDTWYVSRMGTAPLAAMGLTFAVVMIVGALAMGFSAGAASIISRALGAGNRKLAARTVSDGLVLTIVGTMAISAVGYLTIDPLFTLLGADGEVLDLVREYMQVWFVFSVAAIMPPVSDGCLRAAGDMVRPVIVMCVCALLNVVLDPIFIFGWGPVPAMGMKGAAIATVISRALGGSASLVILHIKHQLIDWTIPQFRELLHSWREIIRLGIPAAITQALNPVAQGFYIRLAAVTGGVHAVAAMATGVRIEALMLIIAMAYGTAIVPFAGHNFGAEAHHRVDETRHISNRFSLLYAGIALLILLPAARPFSALFSHDPLVVNLSTRYLLISVLGMAGILNSMWMSQLLNVIGRPLPVMIINLSRVFLFIIPLSMLGSRWFGFTGLVAGIAIGNLFSGVLAQWLARRELAV